ncbi:putative effector protein [Ceratobasidium theobromae]|uniref:Putative effector protein n=1 Tax=Ceratobasidium theobromae TaxID=1582974 RepID=A0A5N5QER5_9AGAM|nr:putative effector protein [Ceratobasidium theobromae]
MNAGGWRRPPFSFRSFDSFWPTLLVATLLFLSAVAGDLDLIYKRQVDFIFKATPSASKIESISSLRSNDLRVTINYAKSVVPNTRFSPPMVTSPDMAATYRGTVPEYKDDSNLCSSTRNAIGYWFNDDYSAIAGLQENTARGNIPRVADAYGRAHGQTRIQGEGGKGFSKLELQVHGTQFHANKIFQDVFGHHLNDSRWMTYTHASTGVAHWDLTTMRSIVYPVFDKRTPTDLRMDLDQVSALGRSWNP